MEFYRWILINIGLPYLPFLIRLYVLIIGRAEALQAVSIVEMPELLFISIYMCIVNLNINMDKPRNWFEYTVRVFIFMVIVFDSITLGMIYSNTAGHNLSAYAYSSTAIPTVMAPLYKFFFKHDIRHGTGE